ncbi:MAG TPA: LysR family transcriptional regulator [Verrucomicrobiae bacterium]|nr:LysR family transcriptional regulator [Verrucomicrobiae bacterium]
MAAFEELSLLRAFVCIVESGSISAGARRLKLPQPTLSRHLRQLEEEAGGPLLRRDTHRMSLTETGHRLLADARAMLSLAEDAEHRLREGQTTLSGHLRLFATIDSGQFPVTRLISSFLQLNPKVTAELGFTNRPLHMIQEGCDVGIVAGEITDDTVVARLANKQLRYLVASPVLVKSRPAAKEPRDLQTWPWLALAGAQFGGSKETKLHSGKGPEQTLPISPVFISEGATSLREAARAGLGICVLPDFLVREDILSGRLVRVLPLWKARDISVHVVYPGHRLLPVRVRAFVDFAVTYMHTELQQSEKT